MVLHNRVSAKELKARLMAENFQRVTLSFYQYAGIDDPQAFRDTFYQGLQALQVFGRVYIAHEGVNAQVSVPEFNLEQFREYLDTISFLRRVRLNAAVDDNGKSFWVLKVKLRDKIVADGIVDPSFDMRHRGKYVDAETFNKLIEDPDTVIVDMRNHYEYEVGHFERAIEVPSDTFREQLPMAVDMLKGQKDRTIVMYCTGGIRCEKASAWMKHNGFSQVYHLEGGIIHYVKKATEQGLPLKFHGKNFVFDERLGERVTSEVISHCHQCGRPCDHHVNCRNEACHLLLIQCNACAELYQGCCSTACRDVMNLPEEQRQELRSGAPAGEKIFNKSRHRPHPLT
jgi:UPF0176 protein